MGTLVILLVVHGIKVSSFIRWGRDELQDCSKAGTGQGTEKAGHGVSVWVSGTERGATMIPGKCWAGQGQTVGSDKIGRQRLGVTKSKTAEEGVDETGKGGMGKGKSVLGEQAME